MASLSPTSAAQEQSKADRVYHELRRRIRELTLPPGAVLRKEEIALEMGVSRAPVSEAIARLADEALVDVFPQHGSFVAPIRAADVRESLLIRTALEVEAIRRVTQMGDTALMATLEDNLAAQTAALGNGDLALFYDLDEALHAAIFSALKAPRALRLLEAARAPLDRPRRIGLPEVGRPEATLAEHRRLVDAIASGDPEFAAAAMRAHLSMVARTVERELADIDPASVSARG
ncbi:MAG TPA: GntR family transcriptional regulator [Caulobacteraceae bacterium]|jgi:DNA-binding GntR family transcriptional regulator